MNFQRSILRQMLIWRTGPEACSRLFRPWDDMPGRERHRAAIASVFLGLSLQFSTSDNPPTRMKCQTVRHRHSVTGRTRLASWDCARTPVGGHQTSVRGIVDVLPEAAHLATSIKASRSVAFGVGEHFKLVTGIAIRAQECVSDILLLAVAAPVGFAIWYAREIGHCSMVQFEIGPP